MRRYTGLAVLLGVFWTPIPPKGPSYSRLYLRLRTPASDNPSRSSPTESLLFLALMIAAVVLVSLLVVLAIVSL